MSYAAIVAKISTRPHPNADRLQIGVVANSQVIVSKDTEDGQLGVFFPSDGQLSHEMCLNNNLYNASARAALGLEPVEKPGFFDHNRRVRAQNFRGVKSEGFWVPLEYLEWTGFGPAMFNEGDTFTELGDGIKVCNKYYTPATLRAMKAGTYKVKRENAMFPKHTDTGQFKYLGHSIPDDAVIYITEKLHGTSGRYGRVLDPVPQKWWEKLLRRPRHQEWTYLNGSRNVILEHSTGEGFYGTNDFRYDVIKDVHLHKGEILYFEIVGYVSGNTPIMPPQSTAVLKDKAIFKAYGDTMHYKYGCPEGTHRIYVYKIVQMNEDGVGLELSWTQMAQRCKELGLNTVPLLYKLMPTEDLISSYDHDYIKRIVEQQTTGPSVLDTTHIREGVVLRIESSSGIQHLKNKSFEFGVLEGYIKEKDDYVDMEEAA